MTRIVGFAGLAGSGKDTAAAMLGKMTIGGAARLAFADPIKRALMAITGEPLHFYEDRAEKEAEVPGIGLTRRELMQTLGTEWGRDCNGPDFWVNIMAERVKAMNWQKVPNLICITDVRMDNEAEYVRSVGTLIHILRRPKTVAELVHRSEAGVLYKPGDYIINNYGDLEYLRFQVKAIKTQLDGAA